MKQKDNPNVLPQVMDVKDEGEESGETYRSGLGSELINDIKQVKRNNDEHPR